jgi:hypothetical protein
MASAGPQEDQQVGAQVDLALLRLQNSATSNAVLTAFAESKEFSTVAHREEVGIIQRDQEDGEKLAEGIQFAIEKGILPKNVTVEPTLRVDVLGKSSVEVAHTIITALGAAAKTGCVLVLQGLSGTGKGTTVDMLKSLLPRTVTWSNGNLFRSLTLLATTYCTQNDCPLEAALTPANLAAFVNMLSFGKHNGKDFDVRIQGLGLDVLVASIVNTDLKKPSVGANLPTVARLTQGEVINFVGGALKQMADDGCSVLLEGREQTLNYIRTPYRFELVLSDTTIIGRRRAAQRMAAMALHSLKGKDNATAADVRLALEASLQEIAKEASK